MWYRRCLILDAKDARIHANIGYTLHILGRFDEAIGCYHCALTYKSDFPFVTEMLTMSLNDSLLYISTVPATTTATATLQSSTVDYHAGGSGNVDSRSVLQMDGTDPLPTSTMSVSSTTPHYTNLSQTESESEGQYYAGTLDDSSSQSIIYGTDSTPGTAGTLKSYRQQSSTMNTMNTSDDSSGRVYIEATNIWQRSMDTQQTPGQTPGPTPGQMSLDLDYYESD